MLTAVSIHSVNGARKTKNTSGILLYPVFIVKNYFCQYQGLTNFQSHIVYGGGRGAGVVTLKGNEL